MTKKEVRDKSAIRRLNALAKKMGKPQYREELYKLARIFMLLGAEYGVTAFNADFGNAKSDPIRRFNKFLRKKAKKANPKLPVAQASH
jgi:hypothetical protein